MADLAKLTIRVTSNRGSSNVQFSTTGRYVRLVTAGINVDALGEPVQPTTTAKAFWLSVLTIVQAQLTALE